MEENQLEPRPYQIDLYEKALEQNTIVYLPTGSGKTFISIMLIKGLSKDIMKPYSEGGKRTIFAVNSVALVTQQSSYIERFTGFSCGAYSGDMKCDYWNQEDWLQELEKHQVLVLTAQILLDMIVHGYFHLERINLLIFDECHRAVNDHPMRSIMQLFEKCTKTERPRVLALSATLLNKNVKPSKVDVEIRELETTFHAKIATVDSEDIVKTYATNPNENIVTYSSYTLPDNVREYSLWLEDIIALLKLITIKSSVSYDESSKEFQPKTVNSKLTSILDNVKYATEEMGLFGGCKALLLHIIQLESLKRNNPAEETIYVFEYIISQFVKIKKLFHNVMNVSDEAKIIYSYSSDKIKKLIATLKQFNDTKTSKKFCCIIFTKRRFTTMTLFQILKQLSLNDEDYAFLVPDFIIGYNNDPYKSSREGLCHAKWNRNAMKRFRNGITNCLVATNCVEEGVDIPMCTLIIQYDPPEDIRSYIQSKGRARHSSSNYIILLNENEKDYLEKYQNFKIVENILKWCLFGKSDERILPSDAEIKEGLYEDYEIKPYSVISKDGVRSSITEVSAISVINKYCTSLFINKFVRLVPTWILYRNNDTSNPPFQVSLRFPNLSQVKHTIFGDPMPSIDAAKRSVAMKACIELHKAGELTDHLLPYKSNFVDSDDLLPFWEEDPDDIAGTYKKKRTHKMMFPQALYEAYPQEGKQLFLHVIAAEPKYSEPEDNRHLKFFKLLRESSCYGILSTKPLPMLPKFPLFMNVGELQVRIQDNFATIMLNANEINKLQVFHALIFNEILGLLKSFMVFDHDNLENCYLIVPLKDAREIDWDVVNNHQKIETIESVKPEDIDYNDYEWALVTPNYRGSTNVYIVTEVCNDLTPKSCFPTENFLTYAEYYKERHQIVIKNGDQFMLEVKPVSMKINFIKPRSLGRHMSKRKRADLLEDFEEHLVPELCNRLKFPALYWLKATMLPSILHRLSQLLIAEDLRIIICKEARLGKIYHESWPALVISSKDEEEKESSETSMNDDSFQSIDTEPETNGPEIDVLETENNTCPWPSQKEPTDLYRNAHKVQLIEIEYFNQFISSGGIIRNVRHKSIDYFERQKAPSPNIRLLNVENNSGPSPIEIMQALTISGLDVFDLERLETMGDAFLKYIISLYLFHIFPTYNEGRLTALKGKIIGNKNLYYCGKNKKIPGRMKVDDFVPQSTFIPPAFTTFRTWQKEILDQEVSASVLHEVKVPIELRLLGMVDEHNIDLMRQKMIEYGPADTPTGMEHYVGEQIVSDKLVADSVEALIGVYLTTSGIIAATTLLSWFGILPVNVDARKLFNESVECDIAASSIDAHLPFAELIEKRIGYTFKNRAFLLQALAHPSYSGRNITECYQRLEFLGDALLDFLITGYIYENCGNLTPGALTDLRSALVNNITFACLTVKYGLHTGLLAYAPALNDVIDRFVKFQVQRNHIVDDEKRMIAI
ncbi:endoribonuclease Dcr-2 isoform X2 [Prorops nasuta]|uniref:endoribonuclease Dcr-2 isoform X2 n=1 Tax=Prorops nasuta TaxID=863751 RepID=UPI0034CF4620